MLPRIIGLAAVTTTLGLAAIFLAAEASSGTFDGAPPAPLAHTAGAFLEGWDVQIHERSMAFSGTGTPLGDAIHPLNAQHGPDCSGPPAAHPTGSSRGAAVFQCNNHVMTALDGEEYGVIYLMRDQMADFSAGQAVIEWEMSTERMSVRDWPDITISPLLDAQALPLLSDLSQGVDLQGPNRNSVVITMDNGEGAPNLKVVTNGNVDSYGPPGWAGHALGDGIAAGTNESATRQPMRITLSTTRVRFERLASATGPAVVYFDTQIQPLAWTRGAVQFGHHSYTPTKDNAGDPATWHWDTFNITPSVPFYLDYRGGYLSNSGDITTAPAPANAYLRFSAVCRVSVDGVLATKMVDSSANAINASSYLVPVPAGSTSHAIGFASDGGYGGPCNAKDFSVVAETGGAPSTPTPSSSPTPSPTSTVIPTPTPTATASPVPTATVAPTPTPPTINARCTVRDRNDANTGWTEREGVWVQFAPNTWTCGVMSVGRVP